jgi:hypothetical protein
MGQAVSMPLRFAATDGKVAVQFGPGRRGINNNLLRITCAVNAKCYKRNSGDCHYIFSTLSFYFNFK